MSEKCSGRVYDGYRHWPCSKPAKYERDGKHYCGIHNPEAAERRAAKSKAVYDARFAEISARAEAKKQMEADAARYRFLKRIAVRCEDNDVEPAWADDLLTDFFRGAWVHADDLDAAIDAAMAAEPRYTLTDLGEAYRRAMGSKLNGAVKAGEPE